MMTLNGAIMQLVEMRENSMMPVMFKPYFDKIIETVSECVEPSEIPHWIPCSERLPEIDVFVLVTLQHFDGEIDVVIAKVVKGYFSKGLEWESDDGEWTWGVEHGFAWMPLPNPYEP